MRRTSLSLIRSPYRRSRRSGATLLVVVSAVSVLLGCAALTIDVGYYCLATGHAQSVADACTLAAAAEPVIGHDLEIAERVQETLAANQTPGHEAFVDGADIVPYGPGQTVPGYGVLGADDEAVSVTVQVPVELFFSQVCGVSPRVVRSSATVVRTPVGNGNMAIFALDREVNDYAFVGGGSRNTVSGLVHSNSRVLINGRDLIFERALEWVNEFRNDGSHVRLGGGTVASSTQNDPINLTPDAFGVYTSVIHGDLTIGARSTVHPGCYRVYGNVIITGRRTVMEDVTFVADGRIIVEAASVNYSPNRRGIFAYSLSTDPQAICFSGRGAIGSGTLYAPAGGITLTGAGALSSTIVGRTVTVGGSNYTLRPSPSTTDSAYAVRIVN